MHASAPIVVANVNQLPLLEYYMSRENGQEGTSDREEETGNGRNGLIAAGSISPAL